MAAGGSEHGGGVRGGAGILVLRGELKFPKDYSRAFRLRTVIFRFSLLHSLSTNLRNVGEKETEGGREAEQEEGRRADHGWREGKMNGWNLQDR